MTEKQEIMVANALQQLKMALESGDNYSALRICEDMIQKLAATPTTEINTAAHRGIFELGVTE